MPKTLGEWLFLVCIGSFSFLRALNVAIAILFFSSSFVMGYREGFDTILIALSFVFGFLVVGELVSLLSDTFRSLWPNLLAVVVRSIYLCFAGLLYYLISLDDGLTRYYWLNLWIVIIMVIVNSPLFVFHSLLCFSKFRQRLWGMDKRFRSPTTFTDNKAD